MSDLMVLIVTGAFVLGCVCLCVALWLDGE